MTHGSAGWLAVGVPGPVAYTSVNGTIWRPAPGIDRDLSTDDGATWHQVPSGA